MRETIVGLITGLVALGIGQITAGEEVTNARGVYDDYGRPVWSVQWTVHKEADGTTTVRAYENTYPLAPYTTGSLELTANITQIGNHNIWQCQGNKQPPDCLIVMQDLCDPCATARYRLITTFNNAPCPWGQTVFPVTYYMSQESGPPIPVGHLNITSNQVRGSCPAYTASASLTLTDPACPTAVRCSPTPTPTVSPTPTPTPTPTATPTPTIPPSPTPFECYTGYFYCPPVWEGPPYNYWVNGNCCPDGWTCETCWDPIGQLYYPCCCHDNPPWGWQCF
jgi:hypothetical protein